MAILHTPPPIGVLYVVFDRLDPAQCSLWTRCIKEGRKVCMCVCVHVCVCACVRVWGEGGIESCNLPTVIPGLLAKAMPIARCGTVGVATHHVPCSSHSDVQKPLAFKTKTVKSRFVNKSTAHSSGSHRLVHAKSRTKIG